MSCSLRVLCPHNLDSTPCVVFSTENQRVLIDAGEGVQRLCVEHRVRLGKLESVLLTSLSPSTLSGLPGLCLTCADSGRSALSLVGPRGLLPFWQSTGQFTYRSQFSIGVREVETDVDLVAELDAAYIHCVAIDSGNEEYPTHMCYVIETKPLPGKFDVGRAKALGVPVGPMFGLLQKGTEITLSDGRTIKPQDVLGVAEKSRFAVVVCNAAGRTADDSTILSSLVNHPYWCRFKSGGECEGRLDCMLHFSPSHVTSSSLYTAWIELIGNTTHIGLGDGDCSPESAFLASTLYSCRLNSLFPDVFSLVATSAHQRKSLEGMMKAGCPGMRYNLLPAKQRGLEGSDATESFDLALSGAVDQLWEGREDDKDRADILVRSTLEARSTTDFNDPRANLLKQSSHCAVSFLGYICRPCVPYVTFFY